MLVGGADVGEAMVAHPGVDKIQFVGSGATAKKVLRSAADTLKPCRLELGGKSAVLVFADADLQQAARRGLSGAMSASGQGRSEEHTSELQSLMRIPYAVLCLKKQKTEN